MIMIGNRINNFDFQIYLKHSWALFINKEENLLKMITVKAVFASTSGRLTLQLEKVNSFYYVYMHDNVCSFEAIISTPNEALFIWNKAVVIMHGWTSKLIWLQRWLCRRCYIHMLQAYLLLVDKHSCYWCLFIRVT